MSDEYFWEAKPRAGRRKIYETPEQLWETAVEYFRWVEENPLYETVYGFYQGEATTEGVPKKRPMTLGGLKIFLGIGRVTWGDYRTNDEFAEVCEAIEEVIRTQKFEGAAAGLFNAGLITRDIGLADRKELSGPDGGPMEYNSKVDWTKVPNDAIKTLLDAAKNP